MFPFLNRFSQTSFTPPPPLLFPIFPIISFFPFCLFLAYFPKILDRKSKTAYNTCLKACTGRSLHVFQFIRQPHSQQGATFSWRELLSSTPTYLSRGGISHNSNTHPFSYLAALISTLFFPSFSFLSLSSMQPPKEKTFTIPTIKNSIYLIFREIKTRGNCCWEKRERIQIAFFKRHLVFCDPWANCRRLPER